MKNYILPTEVIEHECHFPDTAMVVELHPRFGEGYWFEHFAQVGGENHIGLLCVTQVEALAPYPNVARGLLDMTLQLRHVSRQEAMEIAREAASNTPVPFCGVVLAEPEGQRIMYVEHQKASVMVGEWSQMSLGA